MFLAANPSKGRTQEEKEELAKKYKVGDEVMGKVETREKSLRERRAEDEDRRLVDEVRNLSLREVGVAGEGTGERRERRRREDSRLRPSQQSSSREQSRDSRSGDDRERRRRREADSARRRTRDGATLRTDSDNGSERRRRRSDAESTRRHEETNRTAARQIEHQSSLRSLISSSDVDSQDMEEEILRQIREEGLLDGIDLENIDVSQEDQISERIAEAFRRRQAEKARQERERRRSADQRRQARTSEPGSREASGDDRSLRRRAHSRNTSAVSQGDEPSRPPPSMSQAHAAQLGVHSQEEGHHRRRASSSRSSTAPTPVADPLARPAARSSTDLSSRPRSMDMSTQRPHVTTDSRSTTDPASQRSTEVSTSSQEPKQASNSSPRLGTTSRMEDSSPQAPGPASPTRRAPPAEISVPSSSLAVVSSPVEQNLMPAPLSPGHSPSHSPKHSPRTSLSDRAFALSSGTRPTSSSSASQGHRTRAPLYPEPSVTCARCSSPHIEYDLHYNCGICHGGNYNVCLRCFRTANFKGCLHWFGFGYTAWTNWEALIRSGDLPSNAEKPHMLIASRYIRPKSTPGGAEGRKTLTNEDPLKRLQSGVFCANCLAWTNQCYWRCDFCNEGDWGFCNNCVNQGKCCTHSLLPLTFKPPETSDVPPMSPIQGQLMPASATILTGPDVMDIGRFKPLTFSTACDVCRSPIAPTTTRFHCLSCTSSKVPNRQPGDYDICTNCYTRLVTNRRISVENGLKGWRRCLEGHRMIIIGFESNHGGQRRLIASDLIGGWLLRTEAFPSTDFPELQKWSWGETEQQRKLVTNNVMNTIPPSVPGFEQETGFPPEGGTGMRCVARWSWYPEEGADDELAFPKGAEIRECEDVNGEWWHGTYMGRRGLFPSVYGRVI